MSLLPWGDWIYHNDHRRDEVTALHRTAVALSETVHDQITEFDAGLDPLRRLTAGNAVLLVMANTIGMHDLQYATFRSTVDALPPDAPGSVPAEIGSMLAELAAGGLLLRAALQIGRLGTGLLTGGGDAAGAGADAVTGMAETATEVGLEGGAETAAEITAETVGEGVAEVAAEVVIEGASMTALAETGIGIFAAVGVDLAFGLIDGAKERDELDRAIDGLHRAVAKAQVFYNTVLTRQGRLDILVATEEQRFTGLVGALEKITGMHSAVPDGLPVAVGALGRYLAAMPTAVEAYGGFVDLRNRWADFVARRPDGTRAEFVDAYLQFSDVRASAATVAAEWDVLATWSEGMRARS